MKMQELTNLSVEELNDRLVVAKQDFVTWRENILMGKEDNYAALHRLRKDIARIKTAIRQRQVQA